MKFFEIERKYLVPYQDYISRVRDQILALQPKKNYCSRPRDTYYFDRTRPGEIYRHRFDAPLQQLTVKSRGGDPTKRLEINLDLAPGDQRDRIEAFLGTLGTFLRGELVKDLEVFEFTDVEVAAYTAQWQQGQIFCLEIEAKNPIDHARALETIDAYAGKLGLSGVPPEGRSLFDIAIAPLFKTSTH